MSRKPTKAEMTSNLLGGLGLEQIENDLYGRVEEDADLERELNALLGGADGTEGASRSRASPGKQMTSPAKANANANTAKGRRDPDDQDDDDVQVDENDPELLAELAGVLKDDAAATPSPQPPQESPQRRPAAVQQAELVRVISDRVTGYQRLLAAPGAVGDASKRRRLERNLDSLTVALAKAKTGGAVDLDSLPPSPPPPPPPASSAAQPSQTPQTPPHQKSVQQAVLNYINPQQEQPQVAAPSQAEMLQLLELRSREYRTAAAAAKAAGATAEALELLKTHRQFEAAVAAVRAGQTVDPDDVPGPPPPLAPQQQLPQQQKQQERPQAHAAAASAAGPSGGGGLAGELAARQAAYKALQDKAATTGDSGKARRMGRIVAQYAEASAALKSGAGYDFSSLPPPPGFEPLTSRPTAAASAAAPAGAAVSAAAVPVMTGKAGAQLRQLLSRQLQYRQAAVQAKRTGDLVTAKQMLAWAKGCDRMIQAAQAGMPVDLTQLPPLPGEARVTAPGAGASAGAHEVCEVPKELRDCANMEPGAVYDLLEKTLKEKLAVAEENARSFKSLGQISTADHWSRLARSATADLDYLLSQKRLQKPPPKFSFCWQTVSAVRCNPDLGENTLEVRVIKGISLPLPAGFKDTELETQVKVELPISTEAPLTQISGWVKGGCDPGYEFTTRFEVSRKARPTLRVFKNRGLKFHVAYKRGFLKKDGVLGSATMKLEQLETQCSLHQGVDLMEGSKAVGGRLEVQVRLREPLTGTQTDQVRQQWLVLEQSNQSLPPSRQVSAQRPSSAAPGSGNVPDSSAYVMQLELSQLKPHAQANPQAADAVRALEGKLVKHKKQLAACSGQDLRQYCSVLQQLAAAYGQRAKAAVQQQDRGKAEKLLRKKKEAEREFQDVSSRLR